MTFDPQPSEIYRFIIRPSDPHDPRAARLLADAHALGLGAVTRLECHDLYFIQGHLDAPALQRLASALLSDPITQTADWGRLTLPPGTPAGGQDGFFQVEVALRPGVTDPVAEQIVRAAHEMGLSGVDNASTGTRYLLFGGSLDQAQTLTLTRRLLANPTIHRFSLGEIEPVFPQPAQASARVDRLPLRHLDDAGLLALSQERRAALDLAEMRAIQAYFQQQGCDPTDVEFETIAQTWSEHCVHKTFKARISFASGGGSLPPEAIDSLINTYLRAATDTINAPWVRSAFVDNAGIIDFDDEYEVSFKVETHNHPSAIEPFGGANTGVGGVIRDVLGVSAKPIANTDVLCFGPQDLDPASLPESVLHPRRIRSGVVAGVQDYGNKMGIPTVNGAVLYDPGYTANPLVFCGCVGLAPKGAHPRQPQPGDRVIVIGGRTGRDGLRGATFSSMTMDAQTGEVSGASVQIGDPITEKGVAEVVLRARDLRLYTAITDCGAGGLSSAVGEMSSRVGAQVDLAHVRLKYAGLAPWEIWLSEAQERMLLAVPETALAPLADICRIFDVEWSDIGVFTGSGRLVVRHADQVVLDLDNAFLHDGIPQRQLTAELPVVPEVVAQPPDLHKVSVGGAHAYNPLLLSLLAHPNIASKADVVRIYDHEVQGGTLIKPLTGVRDDGPSDGCVIKPIGTRGRGAIALANGINPEYGKLDAYRMAFSVVDEAVRNLVALGTDPQRIALLDNFCWGDPMQPHTLGALVQAARACHDAALFYRTPFISGKDSLNNEYLGSDGKRHAIPPTLLISSIGLLEDYAKAVSMDLKAAGNFLYLVGDHRPTWGGSHFSLLFDLDTPDDGALSQVPGVPQRAPEVYRALHAAIQDDLVRACHDLSEGGLAVTAAEMCIGGRLGLSLELEAADPALALFGETNGCLLVEVPEPAASVFEQKLAGLPCRRLGSVVAEQQLTISQVSRELISLPIGDLVRAWMNQNDTDGTSA